MDLLREDIIDMATKPHHHYPTKDMWLKSKGGTPTYAAITQSLAGKSIS